MCKKLFFVLVAALAAWISGNAQPIGNYSFISAKGTYTEITDGTKMNALIDDEDAGIYYDNNVWMGSTTASSEAVTGSGFPIGFDFVYNSKVMTGFAINSHLQIQLGSGEFTVDPNRSRFFFMDNDEGDQINVIGAAPNTDVLGKADTEISYKLIGEAPNRTLVVQFTNVHVAMNWDGSTSAPVDLQIRLNETSNTIDMVFNGWMEQIADFYKDVRVGLKGDNGDLHLRYYNTDNCDWQNTIVSTEDQSLDWNADSNIADGLIYTFTPCADCVYPVAQPTDLNLQVTSNTLKGSFNSVEGADHYLVLLSTQPLTAADLPVDGTYYKRFQTLGAATVIDYTTATSFSTLNEWEEIEMEILPQTEYYVTVVAANSFCMYGPKYNISSPLEASATSLPAAPTSIAVTGVGLDFMEVTAVANQSAHDVVILYTDTPFTNEYGTYLGSGMFGTLTDQVAVGDELEGGGKVLYVGPAESAVKVEGLDANKVYYFAAFSKDNAGNYSSVAVYAENITNATLPYEFATDDMFCGITCGREMNGVSVDKNTQGFYFGPAKVGTEYSLTSQWIIPAAGTNRIMFDMNMYIWARFGSSPYNEWQDGEQLLFETSTDGETWNVVGEINKDNAPVYATFDEYVSRIITFESADQTPVKLRIHWIPKTANVRFYLKGFLLEEKKDCDYPVNLKASDVNADQATITWDQQGNESQWIVNWRLQGAEEWTEVIADSRNLKLSGLPGRSVIEVRVAAKCPAETQSDWSKTISFTSGYVLPFTESFDDTSLPPGWELMDGALGETSTELVEGGNWTWFSTWRMNTLMLDGTIPMNSWVLFPTLNFNEADVNYNLSFTLTNAMAGEESDEVVKIVASKDGGATFTTADVIYTVENADLPADGDTKTYTVSLKGFSGNVRLGLLVSGTTGYANSLLIDEVAITESCPNDAVITMEELYGTMATVSWTGTKDDDQEWMVFIRKAGETSKDYVKTAENTMTFEGLETRTNYEIGVTKACAEDDIARPVILPFTTLADDPCFPLEKVNATADVFSITLEWEGDAYAYNIRYRHAIEQEWTLVSEVKGNTYTIENLLPAGSYLYQVQTLCSLAEGDYSDWSPVGNILTKPETCFAPENIVVEPTHNSAMVTWTADESSFDLEYRLIADEEWNVVSVNDAYELKLNDLTPESTYQLRMRSYCEDSKVSRYSEIISFTTLAIPECVVPSNLRVENIEENAATLLWDAHESNIYWQIKWRESSSTTWNEPGDLTATNYQMTDLVANTAYIWQVKAFCDEGRESDWAVQNKFTTLQVGIDAITTADLTVFGKAGVINILNAQNIFIDNVAVYALNGALLGSFDVNAAENVMIPTDIADNAVVVCVRSGAQTLTFKVVIR